MSGAVLQAVAPVEDRQEIAARGFLDEDRGHVAPIAAAPEPRDRNAAPVDRRAISRPHFIREARRQDRRLAAPVARVFRADPGQQRMIRHAREDLPQAVLRHPEPEPLLQHVGGLLEHEHPQPSRTRVMSGAGPSIVNAALPTTSMSYPDRSASASTQSDNGHPSWSNHEPVSPRGRRARSVALQLRQPVGAAAT